MPSMRLLADQVGDALDQGGLVRLVGELGDHDLLPAAAAGLLDVGAGPHDDAAAAVAVRPAVWRPRLASVPSFRTRSYRKMMPPVGKSGPWTISASSSIVMSGFSMRRPTASQTSPRLWGGMFVAMPTAMPEAPFTSRLGSRDGRTSGLLAAVVEVGDEVHRLVVDVGEESPRRWPSGAPRCSAWPPAGRRRRCRSCPARPPAGSAGRSPGPCAPSPRRRGRRRGDDTCPAPRPTMRALFL